MKKFILLLIAVFTVGLPKTVAYADNVKYSRVLTDGVTLYIDSSLTVQWFTLPVGYYVKVLSISHSSAKVEYKSDNPSKPSAKGYISTEHLNIVDEIPSTLYPNLILTVNQNCMLFKDVDMTISETVTQSSTVDYYGVLQKTNGESYIYGYVTTSSGDKYVGYLSTSAVFDFIPPSLPIETIAESQESIVEESEATSIKNGLGNSLQLIIIIAVSLIAISVVYLLFKPAPTKISDEVLTNDDFYDE